LKGEMTVKNMGFRRFLSSVLGMVLLSICQVQAVLAQVTPPPEVEPWVTRLQTIALALNIIAWCAVAITWFAGVVARGTPHTSMTVRRLGTEWLEWAGIGALLVAGGLTIINFIMWLVLGTAPTIPWPGK